ncbi:MAG: threonylcarbamoyl-AMP synthase [Chloroflexi bacterium]|nr:threonylcarbamoyl-AMP synthase [Chloroflexota bacterium]
MTRRRTTTRLLAPDAVGLEAAAELLRAGGLVGFPTETVYGLGAHALDAEAVAGIFVAKGRPADDPVIVHLADPAQLDRVAVADATAWQLAEAFWPGPLTLVLPRRPGVPLQVTAGLDTVGVRVPSHPVAHALLRTSGLPIAAPSANLFGRPSPTTAQHVLDDLDGRIDAVVDGGPTSVGLESTIVDLTSIPRRLLRPGGLPAEAVEAILGAPLARPDAARAGPQPAPGMLAVHYSPRTRLILVTGDAAGARLVHEVHLGLQAGQRIGVIALTEDTPLFPREVITAEVGTWDDPSRSAARLFDAMRALDRANLDVLYVRDLADPETGLGRALADRLRRAAHRVLDSRD